MWFLPSPALADGSGVWFDDCNGFAVASGQEVAQDARLPTYGGCRWTVVNGDPLQAGEEWAPMTFAEGPWEPGRTYTVAAYDAWGYDDDVRGVLRFRVREGESEPPVPPVVNAVWSQEWEYGLYGRYDTTGWHREVQIDLRNLHPDTFSAIALTALDRPPTRYGVAFGRSVTFTVTVAYDEEDGVSPAGWEFVGLGPDGSESEVVFVPIPEGSPPVYDPPDDDTSAHTGAHSSGDEADDPRPNRPAGRGDGCGGCDHGLPASTIALVAVSALARRATRR